MKLRACKMYQTVDGKEVQVGWWPFWCDEEKNIPRISAANVYRGDAFHQYTNVFATPEEALAEAEKTPS